MQRAQINLNIDVDSIKQRVLEKYKNDIFFLDKYQKLKLNNDNIELSDAIEVIENQRKCINCSCLMECKQSVKGHHLDLRNNEIIFVGCQFTNDKIALEKEYESLIYTTFNVNKKLPCTSDIIFSNQRVKTMTHLKELLDNKNSKGVFLSGPPGVGKTFIIEAILNEYLKNKIKCAYILLNDLTNNLKTMYYSFETEDKDNFNLVIRKLKMVSVLIIDDIGAEKVDAFLRDEILFPILDYRMKNNLTTHFTSNNKLSELEEHYAQTSLKLAEPIKAKRIIERIRVLSNEYYLSEEKSYRL